MAASPLRHRPPPSAPAFRAALHPADDPAGRADSGAGSDFPVSAGIFFGLGLGGFFDGIVLRQILQWHHMLTTAGHPAITVWDLEVNMLWDGLFHAVTYAFVAIGLVRLWRASRRTHIRWSSKLLAGTLSMGFGLFALAEGAICHLFLRIHHVNETVPPEQWLFWDAGFLLGGAVMLIGGWLLLRAGRRETAADGTAFGPVQVQG